VNQSLGPAAVSMLFRVICMLVSSGSLVRVCVNLEVRKSRISLLVSTEVSVIRCRSVLE
jgi:hypothetical protein